MRRERPRTAISCASTLPLNNIRVVGWISDRSVAIENFPAVVWIDDNGKWWSGVPGKYIDLNAHNWRVTHWQDIPR